MKKQKFVTIGLSIEPTILNILEKSNYNRSRLINSLLATYFENIKKAKEKLKLT